MGMVGVMYGYVVRNFTKAKKVFLSFYWCGWELCVETMDRGMLKRLTEVVGMSNDLNATRYLEARRNVE